MPSGAVTFVSQLYTGSISDKELTRKSGLLQLPWDDMEGNQSKNSVCYLEISYSTLDSVSLIILNN